jgi:hypothetical protein
MKDADVKVVVPAGEPIDVDKLSLAFSEFGIRASVNVEEPQLVNVDPATAIASLFLLTAWRTFIEALAKTTGESIQDRFIQLLRRIGSIIGRREPPSWKGMSSGRVTVGQWGPLELKDPESGITVALPYDMSWPTLHTLMALMEYATTHSWCARSRVVYSPEADIWILKRPVAGEDQRSVFIWDSINASFVPRR